MPTVVTSYDNTGVVQQMKVGGSGCCTTAQVSFQSLPARLPQEAAILKADCLIHSQQPGGMGVLDTQDGTDMLSHSYHVEVLFHDQVSVSHIHKY